MSQRLLPRADGQGRALAAEVLIVDALHPRLHRRSATRRRSSPTPSSPAVASTACRRFDQAILGLCQQGLVTIEEALRWVTNVEEFKMRLRGITTGTAAAMAGGASADIQRYGS